MEQEAEKQGMQHKSNNWTLYSPQQQSLYIFICLQYLWSTCWWCSVSHLCCCWATLVWCSRTGRTWCFCRGACFLSGWTQRFHEAFTYRHVLIFKLFLPNVLKNGPDVIQHECLKDWINFSGGEKINSALMRANISQLLSSELYFNRRGMLKKKPPHISNPKTQTMCTNSQIFQSWCH